MSERMFAREYHDEDWPHGLRCAGKGCVRLFEEGDFFRETFHAFAGDTPIMVIMCTACAESGAEVAE